MIKTFSGENRFLSNFWLAEVEFEGVVYPSSESAYQAAKTLCLETRKEFTMLAPGHAKRAGKKLTMRPDWEQVKISVMTEIVRDKFSRHTDLKEKLLATGEQELVEGNHWNDCFWGVCKGKGENNLGKILMRIREELKINS